jgi:hypothetical protein
LKRLIPILSVSILVIVASAARHYAQGQTSGIACNIQGSVVDLSRAVVPAAELTFSNADSNQKVKSDPDGSYHLKLSPGVYTVAFMLGFNDPHYRRSKVVLSCPEGANITTWMHPFCASGCVGHGLSENLGREWTGGTHDAVISYLGSSRSSGGRIYRAAVLTYKNYTLSAQEITLNPRSREIHAQGDVVFENGSGLQTYTEKTFGFAPEGLILK